MAIRIVCPSCSAALSVKDEFAGRAVKCPKCGATIPPSQPATPPPSAPPPAPPPEAEKPPFEEMDNPGKSKSGSKVTGKPVPRAVASDEEDDRPRRKDRGSAWDDADEDRGEKSEKREKKEKGGRDRDEDDEDRPAKSRRRGDDDDDDRPARGGKGGKKGGSSGLMIVLVICGTLLLCCGGVGGAAYYFISKAAEKARVELQKAADEIKTWNPAVNQFSYGQLKVGTTTRTKANDSLGEGRVATEEDLTKAFASDPGRKSAWVAKANQKRVVIWQHGEDYLVTAFHPDAEANGRFQMKEWRPKSGASERDGELDDAKFLQKYPALNATTEIRTEDLSKEYKDGWIAADEKYQNKTFIVVGPLEDVIASGNELKVNLVGVPKGPTQPSATRMTCTLRPGQTPFQYSRGQRIKVSGKCTGGLGGDATFTECTIQSGEADPSVKVTATVLLNDYANVSVANGKYKDKELTVSDAVVESMEQNGILIAVASGKKGGNRKIRVDYDSDIKRHFPNLQVGATIKIKGKCTGLDDTDVEIKDAWFAP